MKRVIVSFEPFMLSGTLKQYLNYNLIKKINKYVVPNNLKLSN